METINLTQVRRLALARAGLIKTSWTGLPSTAGRSGISARRAAHAIIDRFGYLQLDTVSVCGARSHALVLMSRLRGFSPEEAERLLQPGAPLFEYWGHEASWIPLDLYPLFEFRRRRFRKHPWWGDIIGENRELAKNIVRRIKNEGPLRSIDLEGRGSRGWWDLKIAKRVANALWTSGDLAIRERRNFQRSYDIRERVIPEAVRSVRIKESDALPTLLEKALDGHGWARTGTLTATWRLSNMKPKITRALDRLEKEGRILPCDLVLSKNQRISGWIRPRDLELAQRLRSARFASDRGILLSPFDPILWDRGRVQRLFDFEQILEIFKPAAKRTFGYYCLPVLAGERLVGRVDLKAHRKTGTLEVLTRHLEKSLSNNGARAAAVVATNSALERLSLSLGLELWPNP